MRITKIGDIVTKIIHQKLSLSAMNYVSKMYGANDFVWFSCPSVSYVLYGHHLGKYKHPIQSYRHAVFHLSRLGQKLSWSNNMCVIEENSIIFNCEVKHCSIQNSTLFDILGICMWALRILLFDWTMKLSEKYL